MKGKKFNYLRVLEDTGRRTKSREKIWRCQCDCGTIKEVRGSKLKNNTTKSCGCHKNKNIAPKFRKDHSSYKGYKGITGTKWLNIKTSAEARGKEFSISIVDAWQQFEKQNGKCALSGVKIKLPSTIKELKSGDFNASLDRIDSELGYTKSNIQWVDRDVNYAKYKMTQARFIELCAQVTEHNLTTSEDFAAAPVT